MWRRLPAAASARHPGLAIRTGPKAFPVDASWGRLRLLNARFRRADKALVRGQTAIFNAARWAAAMVGRMLNRSVPVSVVTDAARPGGDSRAIPKIPKLAVTARRPRRKALRERTTNRKSNANKRSSLFRTKHEPVGPGSFVFQHSFPNGGPRWDVEPQIATATAAPLQYAGWRRSWLARAIILSL